jgi:hypothetical protein
MSVMAGQLGLIQGRMTMMMYTKERTQLHSVRFQVLTTASMNMTAYQNIALCSLIEVD